MPSVSHVYYPFDNNVFTLSLWERGNAPDYSIIYAPGVQAARGDTMNYQPKNCPKNDPVTYIEATSNAGFDLMKINYIGINYGSTGDGMKWYFVDKKTILNYPHETIQEYAVGFNISLDYWETYKDKLGNPNITLSKVTTNNPGGWNDTSRLEQDIIPFSGTKVTTTSQNYSNWKTIVGWQAKKPTEQDNYIIDGMRTTMQFNDTGDLGDYLNDLEELATGTLAETNIWNTYLVCNTYIVQEYFATNDGGESKMESLTLGNTSSSQVHNRLNYYPYKRAFIKTIDGQSVEFDYKKFADNKLPATLFVSVYHSTLPQPTSTLVINYPFFDTDDVIVFSAYPTMDFVGKNITPVTQLSDASVKALDGFHTNLYNALSKL